MKRIFYFLTALAATLANPAAAHDDSDSLELFHLQQIEITATRATAETPVAFTEIREATIQQNSYGTDLPSLLALTPSMIATNETGIGIGATSIRLRGTDATRLNVTINGVAMNNPDSHAMYWYDTPDLISAVGSVQVQRGAGVSTNGTGAFGGAVAMTTDTPQRAFGGESSLSYGAYNTQKQAIALSSGLLGGRWAIDARLTHIGSDGYIDRGATELGSYLFQTGYYKGATTIKLLSFGGKAKTYLTYNGVSKEDMARYGRCYHTSGQYVSTDGRFLLEDGTRVDYYDDQTDNYLQLNNQLLINHRFNQRWSLQTTLFYTYGYGYYKQYRDDATLAEYGIGSDYSIEQDLIRRKVMQNDLGGLQGTVNYTSSRLHLTFGGSWSLYRSPHWGDLEWVDQHPTLDRDARWYDNDVKKRDGNLFARGSWQATEQLTLFADLQLRHVRYKAWGVNDNFVSPEVGMQPIAVDERFNFLNPHLGLQWRPSKRSTLYASFAIAQKEPTRSDYTDRYHFSSEESYPTREQLFDYEAGYTFRGEEFSWGINLYWMQYRDQLVPTGMVNEGSDALNINVPDSYRRGVELTTAWEATPWLRMSGNATLSENKIENYIDALAESPTYGQNLGKKTIAYSPSMMGSLALELHHKGFSAQFNTRFVGKQYFTNNETEALTLDRYTVTDLHLGYTLHTKLVREVRFGLQINNLFNRLYSSNGYGYSYMWDGVRYDEAFYFPQAPLHCLGNITVCF
ncbi:MAG: TonB-dependent receptor [Alistipes sp.]|nr:TonB-dependent receptor [Alistipes sp.]